MAKEPKYRQVEESIHQMISSGELKVGDQVPTEEELCEKFGFSRMTVNKALSNLSAGGYIERIPGRGSFVRRHHVDKSLSAGTSFTEDMAAIGLKAGAKLLSYEVVPAAEHPKVAEALELGEDDLLHHFIRLRTGDDIPVAISDTFIAATVIPAISVECLNSSFYEYVRSLGLKTGLCRMSISASIPTAEQRRLLSATDIALLTVHHVTCAEIDGRQVPYEYITTYYNGDTYTYQYTV